MNTIKAGLVLVAFWLAASLVMAGGKLSTEEIKQVLSGNSVEEKNLKWGYVRKFYFDTDGKFRRVDQNDNKSDGTWFFGKDGELCILSRKKRCWNLKPADGENTYNVHSDRSGELKKIWKVKQGNSYNL